MTSDPNQDIKPKRLSHGSHLTLWVFLSVGILIILGMLLITPYMIRKSAAEVWIRIPKGATMEQVADTIRAHYPEDYADKLVRMLKINGFKPEERYGMYQIPAGTTPFAASQKLTKGGQTQIPLTINGFRTLDHLAERMALKMDFTAEEFKKAATDSAYLARYGLTPEQALSLFLDDSYSVDWMASPREVLDEIGKNYLTFWHQGRIQDAEDLRLSPAEVMIIASIVDEETHQSIEKGKIGRLYINRLDKNMRLQADPTVKFATGHFELRRVGGDYLKFDSPYNTYRYAGLPPGPIRTTSRATVDAILRSAPSTDLYMCARPDGSGFHNFTDNDSIHRENARKYQEWLDEKGIR